MEANRVFFALSAFTFLALYFFLIYAILSPFLAPLVWAGIIGISTFPLYRALRRRLRGHDNLAAAFTTIIDLLAFLIPFAILLLFLITELDSLYRFLQGRVASGPAPPMQERIWAIPFLAPILDYLQPVLAHVRFDVNEVLLPALQNLAQSLVEGTTKLATVSLSVLVKLLLMILVLFFVYRDGERFLRFFWSLLPLVETRKAMLQKTVGDTLLAVIYGIFLTAVLQGILGGIGYWIAGLRSPVLLGFLTAFSSIVPVVGTTLVWLPAGIFLLLRGELFGGIFLLIWGLVVVGTSDNIIRPLAIGSRGKIHFLVVLFGVLGGLATFGFVGLIIGPIVLVLFSSITATFREILPVDLAPAAPTAAEIPVSGDGGD